MSPHLWHLDYVRRYLYSLENFHLLYYLVFSEGSCLIRPTWGLIVKMAHYVDLTKNKVTVTLETDQISQITFCFPTVTYLLMATKPPDSRPLAT